MPGKAKMKLSKFKVMVVGDDNTQKIFSNTINKLGCRHFPVSISSEILTNIKKHNPHILFIDITSYKENSFQLIKKINTLNTGILLVMISSNNSFQIVVESIKAGAWDCIKKPITDEVLDVILKKASVTSRLFEQADNSKIIETTSEQNYIICNSKSMTKVWSEVNKIAATQANVLLSGESGVGKDVVARYIHSHSPRRSKPFVPVNCASLPEHLLGSELFGHEKGAFTGAISQKRGLFEFAHCGTIFLDEICEMSLAMQAELLRFLEDFKYRRLGSNELRHSDVRVISATNYPPMTAIEKNKLREDLYYRLGVVNIHIPPLRERRGEIPDLVNYFLEKVCRDNNMDCKKCNKSALEVLMNYNWPGNVRELKNVVQQAIYMTESSLITAADFPVELFKASKCAFHMSSNLEPFKVVKKQHVREFEKLYFQRLLSDTNGNMSRAANIAGISRKTIYSILKGIDLLT